MKQFFKKFIPLFAIFAFLFVAISCEVETDDEAPKPEITETQYYEEFHMTAYNFTYPSTDPFGDPVILSGTITIGDEVEEEKSAAGLVLYNHFTVNYKDECPSHGDLAVQKLIVGSGLITISSDYYGFGITGNEMQAYCMANTNAQGSIDALFAAKELLSARGYKWGDVLFNAGYSQGGQTSIAVLKLASEKYPDLKFSCTFAGGGPYSISETYRSLITAGESEMVSTVIGVILAYNHFYKLGVDLSDVFKEPVLNNLDEWLLSKEYKSDEIEEKIGTKVLAEVLQPDFLNLDSEISKKFMAVMDKEDLCSGWTPNEDEQIVICHNEDDAVVPVSNANKLIEFFESKGLPVTDDIESGGVYTSVYEMGSVFTTSHKMGAISFFVAIIGKVNHILGTEWTPSEAAIFALISS